MENPRNIMPATQAIIEKIRSNPKIPAPSQSVFKILELTRDRECRMEAIAAAIRRDAGLTAQLLRETNSALYGLQTPTSSVLEACKRLGIKRVRAAVINRHIVSGLGQARPAGFDAHSYWQSAFAMSVAASDLSKTLQPDLVEEAGTAGLLCDIGIGLLAFGLPQEYQCVLEKFKAQPSVSLHVHEAKYLGLTHAEVGAEILGDWRLDDAIINAVRRHHLDPTDSAVDEFTSFERMVATAVIVSEIALAGSDMDRVERLFALADSLTDDSDALVNHLLEGLVQNIQQTAQAMSVELGTVETMQSHFDDLIRDLPDVSNRLRHSPARRE